MKIDNMGQCKPKPLFRFLSHIETKTKVVLKKNDYVSSSLFCGLFTTKDDLHICLVERGMFLKGLHIGPLHYLNANNHTKNQCDCQ